MPTYKKVAALKTAEAFQDHLTGLGIQMPFERDMQSAPESPLAQALVVESPRKFNIGNRFCVLPMEGWDGLPDGHPSENTYRRWQRFGVSGAKLVWGGEAAAIRQDGRANPNQLMITNATLGSLVKLRETLVAAHRDAHSQEVGPVGSDDPVIGIQLTHSGRYSKPNDKKRMEPMLGYDHPLLNQRLGLEKVSGRVMSDDALDELVECYIQAAGVAQAAGFDFVDVKLCHGYLGHELLSAFERPGKYGGSLENRTRFPREIIHGILARVPGMGIGVRLSVFDFVPFKPGPDGVGVPDWEPFAEGHYPFAFGGDGTGLGFDLREPIVLIRMLENMGVRLICLTAGSPYYNPHIQRPAYFPPSDGYLPPEDPLVGVARQIEAVRQVKAACPDMAIVGSAYTALQDYLPNVAQAVVRSGAADFIGLGRMMLSYPEFAADMLAGRGMQRKRICRTFSDCTTAPRNGLVSGCYPLDAYYKESLEAEQLEVFKKK